MGKFFGIEAEGGSFEFLVRQEGIDIYFHCSFLCYCLGVERTVVFAAKTDRDGSKGSLGVATHDDFIVGLGGFSHLASVSVLVHGKEEVRIHSFNVAD